MNEENCSPNHTKGSMKPKTNFKKLETKNNSFFQSQESNNSGFECIFTSFNKRIELYHFHLLPTFHAHL